MGPEENEAPPEPAVGSAGGESSGDEPGGDEQPAEDGRADLERERDELRAIAQRTQADFVNYKRRMEDERTLIARSASAQVLTRLFPLIDDLQRAVDGVPEDAPTSWTDGVSLILQNMRALVVTEGASAFEPAPGDVFDPAQHEAVYYEPTAEQPPGVIVSTVSVGYRTGDRVLRPAQVAVAREPEPAADDEARIDT